MMALDPFDENILKKAVKLGHVSEKDTQTLREEKRDSNLSAVELILKRGFMSEVQMISFLAEEFKCASINPNHFVPDEQVIRLIAPAFAHKRRVLPISKYNDTMTVAMENPSDLILMDDLKVMTHMKIRPAVTLPKEMTTALQRYYPQEKSLENTKDSERTIQELVRIVEEKKEQSLENEVGILLRQAQETPVIKVANFLLLDAIRRRASDLFVEPWENTMRVRCRVDGLLEEIPAPPKTMGNALVSRFKVMSQLNIAERRIPQDGRFKIKVQDREVDIRVSILPTSFGEKVCLRILDKKAQAHDLDKLGFASREISILQECSRKPHGMILVTGPTGSGKTTTLYSVLQYLDSPDKNITAVEDPVEYEVEGINQVNVREAINLSFPVVLRSILRQDPDVILIGEIRDQITMDIAIKAALTGHLVLSTLHTNDTTGSIVRMLNMGIEPFLITSSVLMISAQRLVRRLCPSCKLPFPADEELINRLTLESKKSYTFYRPAGCAKCRSTGFSGRTVITEILLLTPEVKAVIMKRLPADEIKQLARRQGMNTLRQSGIAKALAGETSLDEVFRVTAGDQELEVG
ncbi:MAG: Flp pilus assembly complex ATPase component TadA [Candidatus Omnitrophica bacterium]|nr:Flp pilus assembly complex ATPase component TadA [Candidatus Omnitrophota bacterium]